MLIYLHGFLSSPASRKARLLAEYLERRNLQQELTVLELPPDPKEALKVIEREVERAQDPALVGSSLGGYYATYIAERRGLKAVLINPAVRPYDLLKDFLGLQKNLYTGVEFIVKPRHLHDLRRLDVAAISEPERYLLLVETGDEVLDYREAVEKYRGAQQIVIDGGDHSFRSFAEHIPRIVEFANCSAL